MNHRKVEISYGASGSRATLTMMRDLVRECATPEMRDRALSIAAFSVNPADQAEAVERWVRDHVIVVHENPEILLSPEAMVRAVDEVGFAYGDCDDTTMLAACLLYALGFEVRLKAIMPDASGAFRHVFVEYRYPGSPVWRPMDVTVPFPPVWSGDSMTEVV